MIIRNDDIAADTTLDELKTFCEICDRHGIGIVHAITPIGNLRPIQVSMDNVTIRRISGTELFSGNLPVVEFLRGRRDAIGIHGLWHTHQPTAAEIAAAYELLVGCGFEPQYFIPPFNEGVYPQTISTRWYALRRLAAETERLESFLTAGKPEGKFSYLHSWRFDAGWGGYTWRMLDQCLARLTQQ